MVPNSNVGPWDLLGPLSKNPAFQLPEYRCSGVPDRVGWKSLLGLYDDYGGTNCGKYRGSVSLFSCLQVLIPIPMWRFLALNLTPYPVPQYPAVCYFGEISNFMPTTSTSTSVTTSTSTSTSTPTSIPNFTDYIYIPSLELRLSSSAQRRRRATSPSPQVSSGSEHRCHPSR